MAKFYLQVVGLASSDKRIYQVAKEYYEQWHCQTMSNGTDTTNEHQQHI